MTLGNGQGNANKDKTILILYNDGTYLCHGYVTMLYLTPE